MTDPSPYRVGVEQNVRVLVTTTNAIEGHRVTRYLGIVRGVIVRSPSIGAGIVGAFKSLGGGNIQEYSDVCEGARHDAYTQMVKHAEEMGAHAILAMHYDATEFAQGATEVLAYGTAVELDRT